MALLGGLVALSALGSAPDAYQKAAYNRLKIDDASTDALSQAATANALKLFSQQVPSLPGPSPMGGQGGGGGGMPPPGPPGGQGAPQFGPPGGQPPMPPQGFSAPPGGQGGPGGPPMQAPGGMPMPRPQMPIPQPGMGGPAMPGPTQGSIPPWAQQQQPQAPFPQPKMQPQQPPAMQAPPGLYGVPAPTAGAPQGMPNAPNTRQMAQGPQMGAMAPPGQPQFPPGAQAWSSGGPPPGAVSGPSGAGGQPDPKQTPLGQQFPNMPPGGFDWRQMIKMVFDANPGIEPRVAAKAVNNLIQVMNPVAKQEWLQAHNDFLNKRLEAVEAGKDFRAGMADDTKREGVAARIQMAIDKQDWQTVERLGKEAHQTSEREGKQEFTADEKDKDRTFKGAESDKRLAAQLERAKLSIEGKQTLGQMNIRAKAELTRIIEEGKDIRTEASADLKRELAKMRAEDIQKLQTLKGEQAQTRVETQQAGAADRQATGIQAQGERQDKALGVRADEGQKNRESRERIAANRTTSQKQAIASVDDESLDAIAKRVAEYKQAPYAGGGRGIGAAVMARVGKFNGDYDAKEWGKRNAGEKAFGTGKQGDVVRSIGTAYRHMATLAELGEKLDNGETVPLNRIFQTIAAVTGGEAPTNFDAAKQIVVAEVIKGIVASGGGVKERQAAEERVSRAASPEQLFGLINHVYKPLLEGQLEGYRGQYKTSTGKEDFDEKFMPKKATSGKPALGEGWKIEEVH